MRTRHCLLAALTLLVACAASAAEPDWNVRVTPYGKIYPALELSQARRRDGAAADPIGFGEGSGLVAVRLRAHRAGERVVLSVDADGLEAPARVEAVLAATGRDYVLRPPLAWDPRQLLANDAPRTTTLRLRLTRDTADAGTRTLAVELRPLSEALYFVRDGHDAVDLSWIFAAYVDERDAVVERVLDAARASGIVEQFDAYAQDSADAVYRQVWAVWQALAAHGIRYSNADPGIERGPRIFSQRVRLLGETWADRSANCIDGSVLILSVLQRIGLRGFLVLVPGHAFVGFHLDAAGTDAAYVETTLLGAAPPPLRELPRFAQALAPETALQQGIAGYSAALALGRRRMTRVAARFDRAHRPDYALIDIDAARAFGIRPIESVATGREAEVGRR